MRSPLLITLLLIAGGLAGCLGGSDTPAESAAPNAADRNGEPSIDTGSPTDDARPGGAGSRAHKHDYWRGKTEATLVDADFTPVFECGYWNPTSSDHQLRHGCIVVEMGNGSIVNQGTDRLVFTATWSDPKITGLAMFYRDAKAAHEDPVQIANGIPMEIPVTMETADMAHSKASKWAFNLYGGGNLPAGTVLEKVHVTVTIHRGLELPLDPPHPDFWGNGTSLDLMNASGVLNPPKATFLVFITDAEGLRFPEGTIVPPGTRSLDVRFTYKIKDPAPGITYEVRPFFKSAENPFWNRPQEVESDAAAGTLAFSVDVVPAMTDSPYATESQWEFAFLQYHIVGAGGANFILPTAGIGNSPLSRDIEYTLSIVAHGDAGAME